MKLKLVCAALIAAVMLAGCSGNKTAPVDIDPADAAQTLVQEAGFADISTLTPLTEALLGSFYAMNDKVTEYAIYIDGSGATAREVAVLKVADKSDISKAQEVVDARIKTLGREFENYQPAEMQKINNPVIVTKDNVVYMVLSDDPQKAEQAIEALYEAPRT